ncbi:MAG: Maf family protein [Patescibacteria group bacterium]|nr:Maf family protein [Patescibacteria group bacterium]
MKRQIILASTSPRRRELLKHLGIKFQVADSGYEEVHHKHFKPQDLVKFLAEGKARSTARRYPKAVIIAADTSVYFKGKAYGKPKNLAQARSMLKGFSGKTHQVYTGLCVLDAKTGKTTVRAVKTLVTFRKLNSKGLKTYLMTGEPMGKAGAYAIQGLGAGLIEKVSGDYNNVVGLPLTLLEKMLGEV